MANRTPRVVISSGHGMSSRVHGKFDPGARDEATRMLVLCQNITDDLRALKKWGMSADHRARGYYAKADDDALNFGVDGDKTDIFLEIHGNAFDRKAHGTETFTHTRYTTKENMLAKLIQRRVVKALGTLDRGVKRADLAVLSPHRGMASVLSEPYFVDNEGDRTKADKFYVALELAYVNSILEYCGWRTVKSRPRYWGPIRRSLYRAWR